MVPGEDRSEASQDPLSEVQQAPPAPDDPGPAGRGSRVLSYPPAPGHRGPEEAEEAAEAAGNQMKWVPPYPQRNGIDPALNVWKRVTWFAPVKEEVGGGTAWRAVWTDTIDDLQVRVLIGKTRLGPNRKGWIPLPSSKAKVRGR